MFPNLLFIVLAELIEFREFEWTAFVPIFLDPVL
jgi:hypothetical protein